jgi:16S rRNA processing protein RimM
VAWVEWRARGADLQVRLEGVDSRDEAQRCVGSVIEVPRSELPEPGPGEFYRADLIGCVVRNLDGAQLGLLDHFIDAPANAVMVVREPAAADGARPGRERWLPLTPRHLRRVDVAARTIWVDWPEDF